MGQTKDDKNRSSGLENVYWEHHIESVKAFSDYTLYVVYKEGVVKLLDGLKMIKDVPELASLKDNLELFLSAKAEAGGIVWNEELDISSWYTWEHGATVKTAFSNLIGMKEATTEWGLNESTIRKAIASNRLEENIDYKKLGNQYVLTIASIERLYGPRLSELDIENMTYPKNVVRRYKRNMK